MYVDSHHFSYHALDGGAGMGRRWAGWTTRGRSCCGGREVGATEKLTFLELTFLNWHLIAPLSMSCKVDS